MSGQSTVRQSSPQADGFSGFENEEADAMPFTGPVRVAGGAVGPAFGPPAEHLIKARDAAITAMVEPLARMLYQAMQIQHLGAIDDMPFEDLSNAAKQRLVNDARCALHGQSPLYRSEMERQVKLQVTDSLATTALHFPFTNPVADEREQERRRQAMESVVRAMKAVDMSTQFFVAQRFALTQPLTWSAQKQVTLTTLMGGCRDRR
jgi:hypothetical protein